MVIVAASILVRVANYEKGKTNKYKRTPPRSSPPAPHPPRLKREELSGGSQLPKTKCSSTKHINFNKMVFVLKHFTFIFRFGAVFILYFSIAFPWDKKNKNPGGRPLKILIATFFCFWRPKAVGWSGGGSQLHTTKCFFDEK